MRVILLKSNECEQPIVYCLEEINMSKGKSIMIQALSEEEFEIYKNKTSEKIKREYLYSRAISKIALSKIIKVNHLKNITIDKGIFHQPVVKSNIVNNITISISHCERYVAVAAFAEGFPCAVDTEIVDKSREESLSAIMTKDECNIINKFIHNKILILTILWTAKEALSKVLRTGLTVDMKIFEISQLEERDIYRGSFAIFTQYQFLSFIIEDVVFTIVTPKKGNLNIIQSYFEEIIHL